MEEKAKPEVWTTERCYITELMNDDRWPEFSVARCRVEPGVTTQLHALSVHEVYVIESGSGRMRLGDNPLFEVGCGDSVNIQKHMPQSIENTGAEDLIFLCVCAPRFSEGCYNTLE